MGNPMAFFSFLLAQGTSGGIFAPLPEGSAPSVGYFQQVWLYLDANVVNFVVAVVLLLLVLGLRKITDDMYIRHKLRSPYIALGAYFFTLFMSAVFSPTSYGLTRVFYLTALTALTLAAVLVAGVVVIDIFVVRVRRLQFPVIIRDLLVIIVFFVSLFVVLGHQGLDLTAILASAGFVGIVLGLAMQDTLGNIMGGLALQMEKPFEVGNWVEFEGVQGEVIEINWRSVKVLTLDREVVVIPNTVITKSSFRNLSRPTGVLRQSLVVGLPYSLPPNQAKKAFMDTLLRINGILRTPPPEVYLVEYAAYSISYRVTYFIDDLPKRERISDEVHSKLWYGLKRNNIKIPFPIQDLAVTFPKEQEATEADSHRRDRDEKIKLLNRVPFFAPLPADDIEGLATGARDEKYAQGEEVVRQGDAGYSFYVVKDGIAEVLSRDTTSGQTAEVALLKRGDFFGEMSLMTGERRSATVQARVDTEFLVIDKDNFKEVFERHPDLVGRISDIVVQRKIQVEEQHATRRAQDAQSTQAQSASLMARIKSFFGI